MGENEPGMANIVISYLTHRKAREDEAAASRRLNEMEANYGDVIPRRDYEQLQKDFNVSIKLLPSYLD